MHPMPYSVSPRLKLQTTGGKNSMNRSTRMPTAFAAAKWPNSCRMIRAAKPANARSQEMAPGYPGALGTLQRDRLAHGARPAALVADHRGDALLERAAARQRLAALRADVEEDLTLLAARDHRMAGVEHRAVGRRDLGADPAARHRRQALERNGEDVSGRVRDS